MSCRNGAVECLELKMSSTFIIVFGNAKTLTRGGLTGPEYELDYMPYP